MAVKAHYIYTDEKLMSAFKSLSARYQQLRSLIIILALFAISYQVITWKGDAVRVTQLQLQNLTVGLDLDGLMSYGTICNSFERWQCSEEVFGEVVRRFPGSQLGMANFGLVLGQRGQWQKSALAFEKYFKRGGAAYDAMLWYAKALTQLHQPDKALQWYYRSLSTTPGSSDVATALVDHLVEMGRFEEALSVIASFTRGLPERSPFWNTKVAGIQKFIFETSHEDEQNQITKMRIPALVGQTHFIAIKAGTDSGYQFFAIDQRQEEITMTEDVLARLLHSGSAKSKQTIGDAIQRGKIHLETIELGPWALEDIEVTICKSCQPRIGNAILDHVNIEVHMEHETEFLLLSRR